MLPNDRRVSLNDMPGHCFGYLCLGLSLLVGCDDQQHVHQVRQFLDEWDRGQNIENIEDQSAFVNRLNRLPADGDLRTTKALCIRTIEQAIVAQREHSLGVESFSSAIEQFSDERNFPQEVGQNIERHLEASNAAIGRSQILRRQCDDGLRVLRRELRHRR